MNQTPRGKFTLFLPLTHGPCTVKRHEPWQNEGELSVQWVKKVIGPLSNGRLITMLNRTTPRRLTLIVIALIIGILLGLAFFPAEDMAGSESSALCDLAIGVTTPECEALEALYNSTDGANWTDSTNWLVTNNPCSWYQVYCSGGHVSRLLLNGNNLVGTVPAEIGQLSAMTVLNLANNQLSGPIPPEITSLSNLNDLSFANNSLTGTIPSQVNLMTSLTTAEFLSNSLEGPIPAGFGLLSNLGYLDLSENVFTGTIPADLGSSAQLVTLHVNGNKLEGAVPSELCSNIIDAHFGYNKLDPALTDPCIGTLNVDDWENTQTLPPADVVANSPNVGEVQVNWTPVTQLTNLGYYEVLYSTTSGGPYTVGGQTADKQATGLLLIGLDPNTQLFFAVRTFTPANAGNQSDLTSVPSAEAPTRPNAVTLTDFEVSQPLSLAGPLLLVLLLLLTMGSLVLVFRRA